MDPLAAAFWGGFCTAAACMLAASVAAAARGFWRVAMVGGTYALVPLLFVAAYLGWLPIADRAVYARLLAALTIFGAAGLTSQLLLVLRGYRKPRSDQRLRGGLLLAACAFLASGWLLSPPAGLWLACSFATGLGVWLVALAVRKARRGNAMAWVSVAGVSLAQVSLFSLVRIASLGGVAPVAVHATAALSSLAYVAIMGWAMWMRYAHMLELRQVLAQGPNYDPVTRLPSAAQTGKLVGSFVRSGSAQPLGVVAVSLANLALLEQLHGRAAYNYALYVCSERLRRSVPMGTELGRLGEDGFLVLLRSHDPELLKHVAGKLRRVLTQPVRLQGELDTPHVHAIPPEWQADAGIGIALRREGEGAGAAVAAARALSRAACASPGRIAFAPEREAAAVA